MSRWFLVHRVDPGDAARRQCFLSRPWPVVPLWVSMLVCPRPAILRISISCRQCWPYKGFWRLALFVGYPKHGGAEVRHRSHRSELGRDVMGGRMESWALQNWHWSVNSANDEGFGHSQLKAHILYLGFSAETLTKHLQLHLLCPSGRQFENGIGRAFGPNKPVWSSCFLYLWSEENCYGLWEQALCACSLSNSDAMFWRLWQ